MLTVFGALFANSSMVTGPASVVIVAVYVLAGSMHIGGAAVKLVVRWAVPSAGGQAAPDAADVALPLGFEEPHAASGRVTAKARAGRSTGEKRRITTA